MKAADSDRWLWKALGLSDDDSPFPWQVELLRRFESGSIERALDIPTGLGKTAVMPLWLVARAMGARLPRRLVYVVDRRAVVDQATEVAVKLRELVDADAELKRALGLGTRSLPVSTLRGQFVDNKEWLDDPASPAIVVGTVDMVGSRLLFEGYGVSRKMRPFHAGLLGVDSLIVLDEAHLVPPFERLLDAIMRCERQLGPRGDSERAVIRGLRLMTLSATGRVTGAGAFELGSEDLAHPVAQKRLSAPKRLTLHWVPGGADLAQVLAEHAWGLTEEGRLPVRVVVYSDRRDVAESASAAVQQLAGRESRSGSAPKALECELFVGGRRVFERQIAAARLKALGFLAGRSSASVAPSFLFATSAGEVGVDLDADHLVCDVVAWERMVQRFGRVNRRGNGKAEIHVLVTSPSTSVLRAGGESQEALGSQDRLVLADAALKDATRSLLERCGAGRGNCDVSPGSLRTLALEARDSTELRTLIECATTPEPLHPPLSRPLADAWSMTSLQEHTGRPKVGPWLRGWIDEDPPQTSVLWRKFLPVRQLGERWSARAVEDFFEAAAPHASEVLEMETSRVKKWLVARVAALPEAQHEAPADDRGAHGAVNELLWHPSEDDVVGIALSAAGELRAAFRVHDLKHLAGSDRGRRDRQLDKALAGGTLVVDARLGGLLDGLLCDDAGALPRTVDDGGVWTLTELDSARQQILLNPEPLISFRVRCVEANEEPLREPQWRETVRLSRAVSDDGDAVTWLVVERWRGEGAVGDARAVGRMQRLHEHSDWVLERIVALASRLELPHELIQALSVAARLHDIGKTAWRWKRAFRAPRDGMDYAKTPGPVDVALLDGYRHELGSVLAASEDAELKRLPAELQDTVLHLIAAHHGFARPVIPVGGCQELPPSVVEEHAAEITLRFARMQKRWGVWGLAWLESLLRAADQQASRAAEVDGGMTEQKEGVA
ncbi:MAG TPA: type I-U CRISPR-associated helicase/endonuclease Cas3 [Vicinamibacterales bacterium]|jgi:CRISPR-associated endonuclease/helicase Cas3